METVEMNLLKKMARDMAFLNIISEREISDL